MREIKFRGRNTDGHWVYGDLNRDKTGTLACIAFFTDECLVPCPVEPATVGQFTGVLDADGREIYEGDVLNNLYGHLGVSYKQEWAAFVACGVDSTGYYHEYLLDKIVNTLVRRAEIKVCGNIHDNPELLERKP